MSAPSWLSASLVAVKVGTGTNTVDLPQPRMNISELKEDLFRFDATDKATIDFGAFQSAELRILVSVPMDAQPAPEAKIGLKFTYGEDRTSHDIYLSVKLILVDLSIVDTDSDGLPNLEIWPARSKAHYMVGDEMHFIFDVNNEYPFASQGIGFSIELIGVKVAGGDLGTIQPGETRKYNITWKINKPTEGAYPFRLRLTGAAYDLSGDAPTAKTKEDVSIGGGGAQRPIGTVIAFIAFMTMLIIVFLVLLYFAKRNKADREQKEIADYEKVYGRRPPGVRTGRLEAGMRVKAVTEGARRSQVSPAKRGKLEPTRTERPAKPLPKARREADRHAKRSEPPSHRRYERPVSKKTLDKEGRTKGPAKREGPRQSAHPRPRPPAKGHRSGKADHLEEFEEL